MRHHHIQSPLSSKVYVNLILIKNYKSSINDGPISPRNGFCVEWFGTSQKFEWISKPPSIVKFWPEIYDDLLAENRVFSQEYKSTVEFHAGGEYVIRIKGNAFSLRIGYANFPSPLLNSTNNYPFKMVTGDWRLSTKHIDNINGQGVPG